MRVCVRMGVCRWVCVGVGKYMGASVWVWVWVWVCGCVCMGVCVCMAN